MKIKLTVQPEVQSHGFSFVQLMTYEIVNIHIFSMPYRNHLSPVAWREAFEHLLWCTMQFELSKHFETCKLTQVFAYTDRKSDNLS